MVAYNDLFSHRKSLRTFYSLVNNGKPPEADERILHVCPVGTRSIRLFSRGNRFRGNIPYAQKRRNRLNG